MPGLSPPAIHDTLSDQQSTKHLTTTHVSPPRRRSPTKRVLHALCKAIYYGTRWSWTHKRVLAIALLLLLTSSTLTSYLAVGSWLPFSTPDALTHNVQNNPQLSPDVKSWLLALRSGDIPAMLAVQKAMNPTTRPPDSALYVLQFSETQAHVHWNNIYVTSMSVATDGLIDTYVEVDMAPAASSQNTSTIVLWHFTTTPDGSIFLLDFVSARSS